MRVLYLLTVAAMAAFAQTSETPLQSLPYSPSFDVTDMDRTVNPCQDFYQYTCGGWLKKNPIPPDQSSWSVYAKLTQDNERFLWGILLDAAKPNPARSNVEREIGDFFAACMDETAVNKAGAAPLTEELGAIGNLKSVADFPDFLAREHLSQNFGMLFSFSSSQDYTDSSREIAFAGAGGLGLPDRDYYTKTDAKSEEIRKKYVEHVARMLELLGDTNAHAPREAQAIMRIETALAKASLTRVQQRDPYNLFHKMDRAKLQALTPAFEWPRYLKATGLGELNEFNVTEPAFYKEVQTLLTATPMDDWKVYLRWHLVNSRAAFLAKPFADANFEFYGKYLRGTPEQRPRWKRCVQYVDNDLGEALGQVFVERTFSADMKARTLEMTREIENAMEDDIKQLPWMSEATKQQALAKLHGVTNKIGYPDKWRDYSSIRHRSRRFRGERLSRRGVRRPPPVGQDRQARGPRRMGHDAAHGERLLRSADERHQFSGRRVAAAAVRSQDGRCAELWRYRRHHRPRTDPRLRRRRAPVRRARQLARLVDRGGRQGVSKAGRLRRRISMRNTPWWTISRSTAS